MRFLQGGRHYDDFCRRRSLIRRARSLSGAFSADADKDANFCGFIEHQVFRLHLGIDLKVPAAKRKHSRLCFYDINLKVSALVNTSAALVILVGMIYDSVLYDRGSCLTVAVGAILTEAHTSLRL